MPERVLDPRKLNEQAVEAAEYLRGIGEVRIAAYVVRRALGENPPWPLTPQEITMISKDPVQRSVIACLGRLGADSCKTVANSSNWPPEVLEWLEKAASILEIVYKHSDLQVSLIGVEKDHRGRRHDFLTEMQRDKAKIAIAANSLYVCDRSDSLVDKGRGILERTFNSLPDSHPTKPLIGIEMELLNSRLGVKWASNTLDHFKKLVETDLEANPHRVATVSTWLIAWGEKSGIKEVFDAGESVFVDIIKKHPEWASMSNNERRKIQLMDKRNMVLKLTSVFLTQPYRRNILWQRLMDL